LQILWVRCDLLQFRYVRTPTSIGSDATSIGWPSYMNTEVASQVRTLPNICINDGIYNEFCNGQTGSVIGGFDPDIEIAPAVTTVHGHHTINFGGEWRSERHNYGQTNNGTGGYNFTSAFTAANALTGSGGGAAFAPFLYGAVKHRQCAGTGFYRESRDLWRYVRQRCLAGLAQTDGERRSALGIHWSLDRTI
jgi:hypothetical protein